MEQQVDTRSVLFTDLVGSTELRMRLGEEAADQLRRVHDELLGTAVAEAGGVVVKGLGDGIMATFTSAADAVAGAVAVQQAVDLHSRHRPELAFAVRVGISVGDVSLEDDDVFGVPVVEASRLCAIGNAGEILVAELVRALGRGRGGHSYEPMGDLDLKGIPEPVAASRVLWETIEEQVVPNSAPIPNALNTIGPTGYVGRADLVDTLRRLWHESMAGATRTVLLAGEPGVGKTRTASEIARLAHGDGAVVMFGRCEEDLAVPYQPFAEALEWYATQVAGPRLGRYSGELTRLVPTLSHVIPGLGEPTRSDAATEEHRLFEAVASWLVDAAEQHGVLLVLDDLHWAAKPTLLMLLHALQAAAERPDARLFVVVTYRDTDIDRTHPLSSLLADLRRLPGVERLPISGLTEQEIVAFLEAAAGHAMAEDGLILARVVHDETKGNPFFVGEVIRHLVESGAIRRLDDRWVAVDPGNLAVPEGVRDVVGRRLSRLSERANKVLSLAAVVGRSVDLDVLCALSGLTEDDVLDAMDEAVRARLVEEAGADKFRFAHALVRTTLYDELSATRRLRAHQKVADVLEKLHPDDVVALAYHCIEGGPMGGDTSRAVRYSLASAEQAQAVRATADAEDRYGAVLDLLEDADPDGSALHDRLRAMCGVAECRRDQAMGDYRELFLEVSSQAAEAGDTEVLVRSVLANQRGFVSAVGAVDHERVEMIAVALEAVGREPGPRRAELLALLASELTYDTNPRKRLAIGDEAVAMARALGDTALLGRVLVQTRMAMSSGPHWEEELRTTEEAVSLADQSGDPAQRYLAHVWLSTYFVTAGRIREADIALAEAVSIAHAGSPRLRCFADFYAIRPIVGRGDFEQAEAANAAALELANSVGMPDGMSWWLAVTAHIMWCRGTFGELADALGVFAEINGGAIAWLSAHALGLAAAGRLDEARDALERYRLADDLDAVLNDVCPFFPTCVLALVANRTGNQALAKRIRESLEPYPDCWAHYNLVAWGPVSYSIGMCYVTEGRADLAIPFFERAVSQYASVGYSDPWASAALEEARAAVG